MEQYWDKRLNELENRVATHSYKSREQQLEEENKALKQQIAQQANVDPMLAEFRNTIEYQNSRRDNFLTFLLSQSYTMWAESKLGKDFMEWEKAAFDEYKKIRTQNQIKENKNVSEYGQTHANANSGTANASSRPTNA